MREAIGIDIYNQCTTGGVSRTLSARDYKEPPAVILKGVCWTIDEKMGQTYIHEDCANTLAQRDYKQPQAVIYEADWNDRGSSDTQD